MRRVEVRRVSNGAVVVYESDHHPRTESVYTTIDLALEAASAWLSGEREVAREHGRSVMLGDPLGGEGRKPGLIGIPFDPPETPATAWERDE